VLKYTTDESVCVSAWLHEVLWMQLLLPRDRLNLNIRNGANVGAMASNPDAGDR